jgi:hypothetical protein
MGARRVLIAGGMALVLVLGACSSDSDSSGGSISDASNCDELAEATFALVDEALDEVAKMSVAELIEAGESGEVPAAFDKIEESGAEAEEKAADLDCAEEVGAAFLCANIDKLSTEGAAATVVEQFQAAC